MILRPGICLFVALSWGLPCALPARAAPDAEDSTIDGHRTPFGQLSERLLSDKMIGTASRAVRFDWRRQTLGVGALLSQLLELNNFKSGRYGMVLRKPFAGIMGEIALSRVLTWGSESTERLALTPYRQLGRPNRFELDVNVAYPLAEGVATSRPGFFPATELVLSAIAGIRYLYYPSAFSGGSFGNIAKSILAPRLSEEQLRKLEDTRPGAMQIDKARFNVLAGLSLDTYFGSGGFFSPRAMFAVPITSSELGWWWELTFSAGWMF